MADVMRAMSNHTTYEQIAFLDRVIVAFRSAQGGMLLRDIMRPCLEFMGWEPRWDKNNEDTRDPPLEVPQSIHTTEEEDGHEVRAILKVHVGTRYVEVPIWVKHYKDPRSRFDVWSREGAGRAEINLKDPRSAMALIEVLSAGIKLSL